MAREKNSMDDVEKFIANSVGYWSEIAGANSKGANACNRRNESIVERRANAGDLVEFLSSFLGSPTAEVRFAAAAFLLNHDTSQRPIEVLRELKASQDVGAMSVAAGLILDAHKIEKY